MRRSKRFHPPSRRPILDRPMPQFSAQRLKLRDETRPDRAKTGHRRKPAKSASRGKEPVADLRQSSHLEGIMFAPDRDKVRTRSGQGASHVEPRCVPRRAKVRHVSRQGPDTVATWCGLSRGTVRTESGHAATLSKAKFSHTLVRQWILPFAQNDRRRKSSLVFATRSGLWSRRGRARRGATRRAGSIARPSASVARDLRTPDTARRRCRFRR